MKIHHPTLIFLSLFFVDLVICYDDAFAVFSILIAGAILLVAIFYLLKAASRFFRGNKKDAAKLFLASLILMFLFGIPPVWNGGAFWAAKYTKLSLNEKEYLRQVAEISPDSRGYRFHVIPWGGFMLNAVDLVFDDSGDFSKIDQIPNVALEKRSYVSCRSVHLRDSFYFVTC